MKILNLYAGLGGNRKKWQGVEVTAVENNAEIADVYRQLHPNDTVIVGDAHEYLLEHYNEFDFIWSSPPCQSHSKMNKFTRHDTVRYIDLMLYQEIILLQQFFKGKWVVENVVPYYRPLIEPSFKIGRHLFWSNFYISQFGMPTLPNFINLASTESKKILMDWLGIHYDKNIYYGGNHCPVQILRNCVHPDVGNIIFKCSMVY
jgi:DNA (cytosine-5)-methyltransferase 1